MAITYKTKLVEATGTSKTQTITTSGAVKAGAVVVVACGGRTSTSGIYPTSVTDSTGNTWTIQKHPSPSNLASVAIAWTRAASPMASGATITITWSGTPTGGAWYSAHHWEGAGQTKIGSGSTSTTSTALVGSASVTGSDWLGLTVIGLPYDWLNTASETPAAGVSANNSTRLDNNNAYTAAPWFEIAYLNGTSGSTWVGGTNVSVAIPYYAVTVTLPYEAMPTAASARNQNSGLWAV